MLCFVSMLENPWERASSQTTFKTQWEEIERGTLTLMRNAGKVSLNYEEMSCAKMKAIKTLCGKKKKPEK